MGGLFRSAVTFIIVSLALFLILFIICLPIAYIDGSAKSAYIKQAQGLNVPWYRATWLRVNAGGLNATVSSVPSKN